MALTNTAHSKVKTKHTGKSSCSSLCHCLVNFLFPTRMLVLHLWLALLWKKTKVMLHIVFLIKRGPSKISALPFISTHSGVYFIISHQILEKSYFPYYAEFRCLTCYMACLKIYEKKNIHIFKIIHTVWGNMRAVNQCPWQKIPKIFQRFIYCISVIYFMSSILLPFCVYFKFFFASSFIPPHTVSLGSSIFLLLTYSLLSAVFQAKSNFTQITFLKYQPLLHI